MKKGESREGKALFGRVLGVSPRLIGPPRLGDLGGSFNSPSPFILSLKGEEIESAYFRGNAMVNERERLWNKNAR